MIFSLQRRFLLFLLLPVVVVLVATGVGSFFYARAYLLDQWTSSARLRLEKAAHQIQMRLDAKRELMNLIAEAEAIHEKAATQDFLMQQLRMQGGVVFVEIETLDPGKSGSPNDQDAAEVQGQSARKHAGYEDVREESPLGPEYYGPTSEGHHRMSAASGSMGMRHMKHCIKPVWVDPAKHVSFLQMILEFVARDGVTLKRLTVGVRFDSFLAHVLEIGQWAGSYACLVGEDGVYLAHTDRLMHGLRKLGESGDPIETKVLDEMKTKESGTIFGAGHPPDKIIGFYKVPTTDWHLVLVSKGDEILAPIVRFRLNYAIVGVVALLVIAFMIRINTLPVARAVADISQMSARVEEGDYSVRLAEDRSDEIGQLKRRFNQMVAGLKQRDLIEQTFGRYVDRTVAEELMRRPEALSLGGENRVVTVMMSDLRGFTQMSAKLRPEQVIQILNRYYSKMIGVIDKYRGIIVDFYGDSILVFFDGLKADVSERAADAVRCALEMQQELNSVSRDNQDDGLPAVAMGIGIHTGEVVVGNIGSETRAKYGIVGSAVNETDRIQALAEGGTIIVSDKTRYLLQNKIVVSSRLHESLRGLEGFRELYRVESIKV